MDSEQAFATLRYQTDEWVASLTPSDYVARLRMPKEDDVKIIRDAVSGYQVLKPHEYLVLDHPVLQRLRYIHQTALAYLVYPTANHTRFDHSLGCAKIAQNIGERLILEKQDRTRIAELRLAALLHDVGHTFLSHLSETIMASQFRPLYLALKEAPDFKGLNLKLFEMMSYFIVTSEPFHNFLDRVVHYYYESGFDLNNIAKLIIHKPTNSLAYMADIISGPFDVDKLDYLVRDCYFTGIRADVDVERVVVSTSLLNKDRFPATDPRWQRRSLVMLSGGVSILEQITFNRMLLFPAVYHHHKVRALECMVKSVFEIIWQTGEVRDCRLRFQNILDFYKLTELQFFTLAKAEPKLEPIIDRLLKRDLLERCLVLFPRYAKDPSGWKHLGKRHYEDDPSQIRWLRDCIWQELPTRMRRLVSIYDLWVDIPKTPDLGDPDRAFVDIGTSELFPLSDFFPYPQWLSAYETYKLKGHVFSLCDLEIRKAVNKVAQKVLRKHFGIEFEPRATQECKIV